MLMGLFYFFLGLRSRITDTIHGFLNQWMRFLEGKMSQKVEQYPVSLDFPAAFGIAFVRERGLWGFAPRKYKESVIVSWY